MFLFFTSIFGFSLTNKHPNVVIKVCYKFKKNQITSYGNSVNLHFSQVIFACVCLIVSKREKQQWQWNIHLTFWLLHWCMSSTGEKPPTPAWGCDGTCFPHTRAHIPAQTKPFVTEDISRKLLFRKGQGTYSTVFKMLKAPDATEKHDRSLISLWKTTTRMAQWGSVLTTAQWLWYQTQQVSR